MKLSFLANTFSTIVIGVAIGIAYSSAIVLLVFWIPGSIFLLNCFDSLSAKTGFLKNYTKIKILRIIPFLAIGVIGLFFGASLAPEINSLSQPQTPDQFIKVIYFIILFLLGFIITFLAEGRIIVRFYSQKQNKIISTILLMNLISYIVHSPFFILSVRKMLKL